MKNYEINNQGKRKSQMYFSTKMVKIGYYGVISIIICFMLYEWLK